MPQPWLHVFDIASLAATPWKNGGGSTREIACWPVGAGLDDFDWRVSIARIEADGPFSTFAGIDRVIMLLDGPGVALTSPGAGIDHRLDARHVPFAFDGGAQVDCRLLGGASSDFNVMSRHARLKSVVRVLHASTTLAPSRFGLLLALSGHWRIEARDTPGMRCAPGEGVWWRGDHTDWQVKTLGGDEAGRAGHAMVAVRFDASPALAGTQPAQPAQLEIVP